MVKFRLFPRGEALVSVIWMLFLVIPMIGLFPFDTLHKQFVGVLLAIFALGYRNTLFRGDYFLYWLMLQFLIAGFYSVDLGYIYLFMFPAWQLGFSTLRKQLFSFMLACQISLMLLSLVFGVLLKANFDKNQVVLTVIFAVFTVLAPLAGREFYKQQEQRKQLYQANQRMESIIKDEERNRIARELHDSLGQSLSVITIKLELAQKLLDKKPESVSAELQEIEGISRSTLKTVREIVSDIRRRSISEELIEINQALIAANIIFTTENEELASLLTSPQQTEFSSVLRESITNIIRHSKASYCSVHFLKKGNQLEITIADNGIGAKNLVQGNGLLGIKERMVRLGGTMVLNDKEGLLLDFTIPLKEDEDD